ncbi:hypothetical protein KSD_37630 [Ktedonobacter sp. SOSP1-85]|uniref:glycosyltransferase 87 family protein n=1 Tax=Ktedonobacter sp. SOSP1-85 TaxID=2778367 RepID=UPI001915DAFF|nr:glycosyltransferase 87 family protein [Ktedonobacter sp. SOSP1-85]GHO75992.1 hypothetical protein KSD_37630 [Ktedonobacter sp. SOSP1-85]
MSLAQITESSRMQASEEIRRFSWRFPLLLVCLLATLTWQVVMRVNAPAADTPLSLFLALYVGSFLPYGLACALIFCTPAPRGRQRWLELCAILLSGLLMRALFLPLEPNLSRDSWRYLWDARVTLLGYSPYVYAPFDPHFAHIRDFIFANSRFRTAPSIYPPVAQGIYLLSYLLAPSNLPFLKGIFVLMDLVSCGGIAYLLARRGGDWSRCILYAWCPLPIIEFALQGHVDASTVMFCVLAVVCAQGNWRGSRVATGLFIALATLTKIYPILLLLVLMRRRDWAMLLTCVLTIFLAYVPYLILGHGQVLGFFSTYASEQQPNAGPVYLILAKLQTLIPNLLAAKLLFYASELVVMGGVALGVLWMRWRKRISVEASVLVLYGAVFAASSHIFPWYVPTLLPWITLLFPIAWRPERRTLSIGLAALAACYFTCATLGSYFAHTTPDWNLYYLLAYLLPLFLLACAVVLARWRHRRISGKGILAATPLHK